MESLLFYILAFILAAVLMYLGNRRNNKILIYLSLSIPVLIGGLRYGVGTDYPTYVSLFQNLSGLSLLSYFQNLPDIEFGFFLLMQLSFILTHGPELMFFISSLLTVAFFYVGLKRFKIKYFTLAYLLYLLIIFPITLNIVRQGLAMSICFFAFTYIVSRQPRRYIMWILIAGLFHTTSLMLLPAYFVGRIVRNSKESAYGALLLKLAIVLTPLFLLLPHIFDLLAAVPFFEKYIKYQTITGDGNNYMIYLQVLILGVVILTFNKLVAHDKRHIQYLFLLFALLEILLTTLGFESSFMKRAALYFSFFSPLLLINFVDIFSDRLGKFLVYSVIVIYGIAYFYLAYYVLGQANIMPYHSIFEENI